ncbi:hypothetical protein [Anaeromyxobacter oryzae]|uniref:Uncharacterized protein n=1 Tax=Anaeromyxobacter oryzae TaxID=2918170 RepID=A0ABM7WSF4_9BACT|nr:hypothetical protein [Anaeromyxobacter oryzae]BDG02397.1 hypothetical protein AMOR_13930 [Anaeromyxobacter oryzae]
MVDHVTHVDVDAVGRRASELARALTALGFSVRCKRGRTVADSSAIEAQDAKAKLRALGFADREYRIFVEYVRQWGFL